MGLVAVMCWGLVVLALGLTTKISGNVVDIAPATWLLAVLAVAITVEWWSTRGKTQRRAGGSPVVSQHMTQRENNDQLQRAYEAQLAAAVQREQRLMNLVAQQVAAQQRNFDRLADIAMKLTEGQRVAVERLLDNRASLGRSAEGQYFAQLPSGASAPMSYVEAEYFTVLDNQRSLMRRGQE